MNDERQESIEMNQPFSTRMRVGLDDVDYVQVLYFARVPHIYCQALDIFFREALELPWPQMINEHNVSMPTVDLRITYRKPLRFGEEFDVVVRVREIGNRKAVFGYEMRRADDGAVANEGLHTVVFTNHTTWEAIPVPPQYRAALERYAEV
jgi:YbgC/YbaW family acyl-CoA thioester hydrolase